MMTKEHSIIIIRRIYTDEGNVFYEPFAYASGLDEAVRVATKPRSPTNRGDMLIVCDIAHASDPETHAELAYIAIGGGDNRTISDAVNYISFNGGCRNWFVAWGSNEGNCIAMHQYIKRRSPSLAEKALDECARTYGVTRDESCVWMSDLIDSIVGQRKFKPNEIRGINAVMSRTIADVVPLHQALLLPYRQKP